MSGSAAAWQRVLAKLTGMQLQVLTWMVTNHKIASWPPPWTAAEMRFLAGRITGPLDELWKRLRELYRLGLVSQPPNQHCRKNRESKSVLAWDLADRPPTVERLVASQKATGNGQHDPHEDAELRMTLHKIKDKLDTLYGEMLNTAAPARQISTVALLRRAVARYIERHRTAVAGAKVSL